MSEELTEAQTRAAFARMRAEDLAYIRPPGSAEALRTVRRRRRAGVAAVAAGVGIAVAGGATMAMLADTDRTALPPAAPSPSALSEAELQKLEATAVATLGLYEDNQKRRSAGKPAIVSFSKGPLRGNDGGISGTASSTNKNGVYVVEILCVGEGTMRAQVWADLQDTTSPRARTPPPGSFDERVRCSDRPTPVKVTVQAPKPKLVYTRIEADPSAVGRAAYARLTRNS